MGCGRDVSKHIWGNSKKAGPFFEFCTPCCNIIETSLLIHGSKHTTMGYQCSWDASAIELSKEMVGYTAQIAPTNVHVTLPPLHTTLSVLCTWI